VLIYPHGILNGERLAECSDEARLHFPRLVAISNGFARMELNARAIIDTGYASFQRKPSREELTGWLQEYAKNHLLFIYTDPQGHPWGQWCGVPERMLPRFKTAADKRSPAPPAEELSNYEAQYANLKQSSADFINISEDFGNVPKSSEALETFPLGIGIGVGKGIGVGIGEKQPPLSPSAPEDREQDAPQQTAKPQTTPRKSKRRSDSDKPYDPGFLRAYEAYPKHEEKSLSETEYLAALESLQRGTRDKAPMSAEAACEYIEAGAAAYAKQMRAIGRETDKIKSMCRWFSQGTYLDYAPKPKVEFFVMSAEEAAASWEKEVAIHG
jgi:hypothetical protein